MFISHLSCGNYATVYNIHTHNIFIQGFSQGYTQKLGEISWPCQHEISWLMFLEPPNQPMIKFQGHSSDINRRVGVYILYIVGIWLISVVALCFRGYIP